MKPIPPNLTDYERMLWNSFWDENVMAHVEARKLLETLSRERQTMIEFIAEVKRSVSGVNAGGGK